jgi:2-keto-3-deoxy-L-fuconate dehydrogenase
VSDRLAGKTALVTAAGQGIGRAIAERLAEEGARVIATDLAVERFADLSDTFAQGAGDAGDGGSGSIEVRALDVTDRAAIVELTESVDNLDVLVNCAGFVHHGTVLDVDDAEWDASFDLNCRSMFWTMQAAIPGMKRRGSGSIINIASVASSLKGVPNRFLYSATKAAIIGMTKATAADFVADGIRVNAICPGTVDSPSWRERVVGQAAAAGIDETESRAAFVGRQPMGRVGTPQEIAFLAAYLASDESSFTTGQAHVIDGGWNM